MTLWHEFTLGIFLNELRTSDIWNRPLKNLRDNTVPSEGALVHFLCLSPVLNSSFSEVVSKV